MKNHDWMMIKGRSGRRKIKSCGRFHLFQYAVFIKSQTYIPYSGITHRLFLHHFAVPYRLHLVHLKAAYLYVVAPEHVSFLARTVHIESHGV